jgi:hypothetical protein
MPVTRVSHKQETLEEATARTRVFMQGYCEEELAAIFLTDMSMETLYRNMSI